ncbi:hypothetical protein [Xanthomonas campestris]|uniref:hypothetical protein n=1 Tax=Xanthomonas campestris TaxID=339 RepID=UPI001EE0D3F7|nr:hypothetical protein [Xanthomonas campestris]
MDELLGLSWRQTMTRAPLSGPTEKLDVVHLMPALASLIIQYGLGEIDSAPRLRKEVAVLATTLLGMLSKPANLPFQREEARHVTMNMDDIAFRVCNDA